MSATIILTIYILSLAIGWLTYIDLLKLEIRFVLLFEIIVLVLFSASKDYSTSFDTRNYINAFQYLTPIFPKIVYEPSLPFERGYMVFASLCKTFYDDFSVFFLALAILNFICYFYVLQISLYPLLSLFIYVSVFYFTNDIIILRFGAACAIIFLNIRFIAENKKWLAILTTLIAFGFHSSALVGFLPIFINMLKVSKKKLIILFICMFIISILKPLSLIASISGYIPGFLNFSKITRYVTTMSEGEAGFKRFFQYLPILYYYFKNMGNITDKYIKVAFNYFIFSLLFMLSFYEVATLARLNIIFLVSIIMILPYIIKNEKSLPSKLFYILYLYAYCIYTFVRTVFFNSGGAIDLY